MKKYLIISILFFGCYTEKQANKALDKAKINYPTITAEKCSEWFPIQPISTTSDSSQYKEWLSKLDSLAKIDLSVLVKYDTVHNYSKISDTINKIIYKIKTIVNNPPAIHDTIKIVDKAKQDAIESRLKETESKLISNYTLMNKVFIFGLFLLLILFIISILKK